MDLPAAAAAFNEGRLADAEAACDAVLATDPRHADAWHLYAWVRERQGRFDEAHHCARRAFALAPRAAYQDTLARVLVKAKRWDDALPALERLRVASPDDASVPYRLAAVLLQLRRLAEADTMAREAIRMQPTDAARPKLLGDVQLAQGRADEAAASYRAALALDAGRSTAWANLGVALTDLGRHDEARAALRRACASPQADADTLRNAGAQLLVLGDLEAAEPALRAALAAQAPDGRVVPGQGDPRTEFHLAMTLLARGDYAAGWQFYEARGRGGEPQVVPAGPRWQGEPLQGRSIVLVGEQGLGDIVQFARYAPWLKAQGAGRVVVGCPDTLAPLLRTAPGVDEARSHLVMQDIDLWCPLGSLPLLARSTPDDLPARLPYLFADPQRVRHWRARLPAGPKVGLCWKGSTLHGMDRWRSLPGLAVLAPLWPAAARATFVSLQKGAGEDEARARAQQPEGRWLALGHEFADFGDLAAVIASLDLVITVDTAVAHVAAALGRRTWILLAAAGTDWRWGADRRDSPWYPGVVRLFRQRDPLDWRPVIDDVARELAGALDGTP